KREWSSDVRSSDLGPACGGGRRAVRRPQPGGPVCREAMESRPAAPSAPGADMGPAADEARMRTALAAEVAAAAEEGPDGDVPVAAVLYGPDGRELARAGNARERLAEPTAQAES